MNLTSMASILKDKYSTGTLWDRVSRTVEEIYERFTKAPKGKEARRDWVRTVQMRHSRAETTDPVDDRYGDVERLRRCSCALEYERDGFTTSLTMQVNYRLKPEMVGNALFKLIRTDTTGEELPEWMPFEIEILQYDNEQRIDRAYVTTDPEEAQTELARLDEWLTIRRADFA